MELLTKLVQDCAPSDITDLRLFQNRSQETLSRTVISTLCASSGGGGEPWQMLMHEMHGKEEHVLLSSCAGAAVLEGSIVSHSSGRPKTSTLCWKSQSTCVVTMKLLFLKLFNCASIITFYSFMQLFIRFLTLADFLLYCFKCFNLCISLEMY